MNAVRAARIDLVLQRPVLLGGGVISLVVLLLASPTRADYDAAVQARARGDNATALNEARIIGIFARLIAPRTAEGRNSPVSGRSSALRICFMSAVWSSVS